MIHRPVKIIVGAHPMHQDREPPLQIKASSREQQGRRGHNGGRNRKRITGSAAIPPPAPRSSTSAQQAQSCRPTAKLSGYASEQVPLNVRGAPLSLGLLVPRTTGGLCVCETKLCVTKLCVERWCVTKLCEKWCVTKLCVKDGV